MSLWQNIAFIPSQDPTASVTVIWYHCYYMASFLRSSQHRITQLKRAPRRHHVHPLALSSQPTSIKSVFFNLPVSIKICCDYLLKLLSLLQHFTSLPVKKCFLFSDLKLKLLNINYLNLLLFAQWLQGVYFPLCSRLLGLRFLVFFSTVSFY